MNAEVLDYLKTQRVCVLAVEMPDGSPHAATVHFAHVVDPLRFVILTNPEYRKYQALAHGPSRASLVVGMNESEMKTLQLDGEVALSDDEKFKEAYSEKFPEAGTKFTKDVLFTFTPTWWRFTDWNRPEGKTIFNSDGTVTVAGKKG